MNARNKRYVPPGGAGLPDGTVLTRSEVTAAVARYARRHGYHARTVRGMTTLRRAALAEYHTRRTRRGNP